MANGSYDSSYQKAVAKPIQFSLQKAGFGSSLDSLLKEVSKSSAFRHKYTNYGAPTKGLIKNCKTGVIQPMQFNPTDFEYSRSVTYANIEAPGMSYPDTQFVRGNIREFNVTLFFWDKPYTGLYVEKCNFLGGFLTPETNTKGYTKPPEMIFTMGAWARRCVMTDLDITIMERDGSLNPTRFECRMSLRQVSTK